MVVRWHYRLLCYYFLFHIFFSFSFSSFIFILQTFLDHYYFMNINFVSKHHQSELIAKQNMELCQEEMGLYICVSLTKDTVKKYGIMLLAALLWLVCIFHYYELFPLLYDVSSVFTYFKVLLNSYISITDFVWLFFIMFLSIGLWLV